jgi:DNA-binding transcriptional LysR family regulator
MTNDLAIPASSKSRPSGPSRIDIVPALADLRLADLLTLLAVENTGSVSGAARELGVTPSQVSKAIARLERQFGVRMLSRGVHGVAPTPEARRMLPGIASAVEELRSLDGAREGRQADVQLTLAGPSYLVSSVLPAIASLLPRTKIRGLELAPAFMRAHVAENLFDVAIAPGGIVGRPASWTNDLAGEVRSVLLGRPDFVRGLGPLPLTGARARELPFIGPATIGGERFAAVGDDCPLSVAERRIVYEVQTIGVALELAASTDHVVFGPAIAARRLLEAGVLVQIPVEGWDVRDTLHVVCNGDRVLSRMRNAVVRATREVSAG